MSNYAMKTDKEIIDSINDRSRKALSKTVDPQYAITHSIQGGYVLQVGLCTYREDAIDEARTFAYELAKKEAERQMLEEEVTHSIEEGRESYFSYDHTGYVEVCLIKTSLF